MATEDNNKSLVEILKAFIQKDYAFLLIIAIGLGFLWLSDKAFFGLSDKLSMMIYPLALFFILFVYLISKVLAKIFKAFFRRPPTT